MDDNLINDEELTALVNSLPDGPLGYCKSWGYRQLADLIIETLLERPTVFMTHALRKAREDGFNDGWDEAQHY